MQDSKVRRSPFNWAHVQDVNTGVAIRVKGPRVCLRDSRNSNYLESTFEQTTFGAVARFALVFVTIYNLGRSLKLPLGGRQGAWFCRPVAASHRRGPAYIVHPQPFAPLYVQYIEWHMCTSVAIHMCLQSLSVDKLWLLDRACYIPFECFSSTGMFYKNLEGESSRQEISNICSTLRNIRSSWEYNLRWCYRCG